jgi:hypothetical protein
MEKYERKIKITRELTAIDTNNDGVDDTLALLNKKDLYVSFLLKQSIKDLGVYTDYEEKPEEIDLGNFWETGNDGSNDFGTNPISGGINNPYGSGVDGPETIITGGAEIIRTGCLDPNALNYDSSADIDCCCQYPTNVDGTSEGNTSVTSSEGPAGCYKLSTGCIDPINITLSVYNGFVNNAKNWCKGESPGCTGGGGNTYLTTPSCTPNGCGPTLTSGCLPNPNDPNITPNPCSCCPGDVNDFRLVEDNFDAIIYTNQGLNLTKVSLVNLLSNPTQYKCPCEGGSLQTIPWPIFNLKVTNCSGGKKNYSYQFYCLPT